MIAGIIRLFRYFQKNQSSDDFISFASHELRTPLSITKWYTEMLLDEDAGSLTENQRTYLKQIESSNQRAIDLVRSLLNVSRLSLDTFSIFPEKVNVADLAEECLSSLEVLRSRKEIHIVREFNKNVPHVFLDRKIVLISIRTLILNALLFSSSNATVVVRIRKHGDFIEVSVSDDGIGIPDKDKDKVFTKMFRASNAKDDETKGSGLGLYITKTIVERSGGGITFSSKEGSGSTFTLFFPRHGMKKKKGRTTLDTGLV
jgi:two-component system, OmpR family, phosphate regulon sensor histidine kinase PhoR